LRLALTEAWERHGRGREGFEAMGIAYVNTTRPSLLPDRVAKPRANPGPHGHTSRARAERTSGHARGRPCPAQFGWGTELALKS